MSETTERVLAAARVRESEQRFRALVTASSDVIYRMSPDWQEMHRLDGRGFLSDVPGSTISWKDVFSFLKTMRRCRRRLTVPLQGKPVRMNVSPPLCRGEPK